MSYFEKTLHQKYPNVPVQEIERIFFANNCDKQKTEEIVRTKSMSSRPPVPVPITNPQPPVPQPVPIILPPNNDGGIAPIRPPMPNPAPMPNPVPITNPQPPVPQPVPDTHPVPVPINTQVNKFTMEVPDVTMGTNQELEERVKELEEKVKRLEQLLRNGVNVKFELK